MADRLAGMAADEIERTVMGAAELIALELLVRFEREVAIGIEHQLDALVLAADRLAVSPDQAEMAASAGFERLGGWEPSFLGESRTWRDIAWTLSTEPA